LGVFLFAGGLACFAVGEISSIYTIIQYGFLFSLYGILLCLFGRQGVRPVWAPLIYLFFMIPLPIFFYNNLSSQLQLLSSYIGVTVIRLFDISVNLEGNVIDLGQIQLQVAEACSGLRYLFPLMSFGFLIGYLYRGSLLQRITIFLTTIPITVLMNSFRIGVIGVTVDKWGIEMAEGFLHDFEGWVVFMGCVGILFLEIALFQFSSAQKRGVFDLINLDIPKLSISPQDFHFSIKKQLPFLVALGLLLITTPYLTTLSERIEIAPARQSFVHFPLAYKNWTGREGALEQNVIETLKFSDYIIADYQTSDDYSPVNFYMAWYESQKKGAAIHSPRSCIPGGGWRIENLSQVNIPNVLRTNGAPLRVNRVLIRKGDYTNVVYYWFEGRGRDITNEYMAKWYIFWDSLTRSRSDGALIRVVAGVSTGESIEAADQHLQHFLKDFYPLIPAYVP
jgi:exosortase D (VPLPA-CTERM-specific)